MKSSTPSPPGAATSNVAQLRDDIDRGRTGDKVDWPDPAAAPLGTDDEAAGRPPPAQAVERARQAEVAGPAVPSQRGQGAGAAWVLITVVLVAVAAVVVWALLLA
ncbi:MAG TPA: hypothetical protein VHG27_05700 [Xanthobacteraceae bacterium]|nr:hypothetical protein [Xanthobacteraceae bacterium]